MLWGYAKWNLGDVIREVYFEEKSVTDNHWAAGSESEEGEKAGAEADEVKAVTDIQRSEKEEMPQASENANDESSLPETDGEPEKQGAGVDNTEAGGEKLPEIPTDQKKEVTLVFGGDVCFYDPYANMGAYRERGSDIEKCISPYLLEEMRTADVCMVNNEFSYSNRGTPLEGKMYTFRSKPENVSILQDMGVDIVSVANNHAYDYGPDAFVDTLQTLEDAGVFSVGGGRNLEEASRLVCIEKNGLKIGYVAATQIERNDVPDTKGASEETPGVLRCFSQKELDHFLDVIRRAKQECDFLVVYIHWGTENTDVPDWAQPHQAQLISEAGADIIVGCHPHCLQGLTLKNGVPVVYSLGNYWFNSKTVDTALLKVKVNADGLESLQMIAARQSGCSTSELDGGEKERVLSYLQSLSPEMTFDSEGVVTW